jgi:hypothetical protein
MNTLHATPSFLEHKSINSYWSETVLRAIAIEKLQHVFYVRNQFCVSLTVCETFKRKERYAYISELVYLGNNCVLPNTSKYTDVAYSR